jgi:hypothetical protein
MSFKAIDIITLERIARVIDEESTDLESIWPGEMDTLAGHEGRCK